jgi:hypothetical protein
MTQALMEAPDLRAEQSSLEAEIARLHRDIQSAEQALAKKARAPYRGSRGFGIGLVVGGALVFVLFVCFFVASFFAYARFMSHMG